MGSLFSKKSTKENSNTGSSSNNTTLSNERKQKGNVNEKDKAMLDLKTSRDKLKKYRTKMETEAETLTNQARQLLANNKRDRALLLLKLKKLRETTINNIDNSLLTILDMISNLEWEEINLKIVKSLADGNKMMKKYHDEMNIEDIEDLMEETIEGINKENEINKIFSQQKENFISDEEEVELLNELEQLLEEDKEEKAQVKEVIVEKVEEIKNVDTLNLPDVPTTEINIDNNIKIEDNREEELIAN